MPFYDSPCSPAARARVLLIEDQQSIRRLIRTILNAGGYSVSEASSGAEGLQLVSQKTDQFHLAVVDVVLPDTNGPEVVRRIRATAPQIGALFTSGYSAEDLAQRGLFPDGEPFLQKPFSPESLSASVAAVIAGTARS
jgi:two-component system, cell cycle sensor histidine kinase and response regulator CckA